MFLTEAEILDTPLSLNYTCHRILQINYMQDIS